MAVAAIYDIHGNLPALEAVLAEIDALGIDKIVIGGDIAYGPTVCETLDRLMALGDRAVWVRGNTDRTLAAFYDGDPSVASLPEAYRIGGAWESQQLTQTHRDLLATLPLTQTLHIAGLGEVLFCHASPRDDEEIFTFITPEMRLREILADVKASMVVCGHTHVQFDRQVGAVRVVNAGSVGMSYDGTEAFWAMLGPNVALRHTPYDRDQAESLIRASGHPLTDTFLETLRTPPSAEEATAHFEKMASEQSI